MINQKTESTNIRILLANISPIWSHIIRQMISQHSDLTIVKEVQGNMDVLIAAARDVDIVILTLRNKDLTSKIIITLLNTYPSLKILAVAIQEDKAVGFWFDIKHKAYEITAPLKLIGHIRNLNARTQTL